MKFNENFKDKVRGFTKEWVAFNHIDYLWRKRFNVAFGSPEHLATNPIDQLIWFEENELVEDILERHRNGEDYKIINDNGEVVNTSTSGLTMTQDEIQDEFDNLDLSKYNEESDGGEHK